MFAVLCTLSLVVPLFGPRAGAAIAGVVLLGAYGITDGPLFELLAYPGDYEDARLYGLITFVLAGVALGLMATAAAMPVTVFVGTVLLVGYGNLGEQLVRLRTDHDIGRVAAFCLTATVAAVAGQAIAHSFVGAVVSEPPIVVFLATSGAFLAALLRDVLLRSDDPIVVLSVGLLLWLLAELEPTISAGEIVVALAITVALGYVSYALETASIAGMLTGILSGLLTIVLGGYGWFAVLISFFAIGGLSTKFRYDRKAELGVAEDNNGARGSGNVLGNAAVALVAVLGYAASDAGFLPREPELFLFAFAGSIATAMSDTLSSEIGSVFETPRLITTLEPVDPGTDGGVTWQGELAGVTGAAVVASLAFALFPEVGAVGAAIIVAAGIVGMTVDSLLGATLEGSLLGNQGVNFLATLSGALACALLVVSVAVPG
ncbi:TIGR00297 family protein [Natrinema salifodinae]|uniref:TIGR00297 family protein n=1 Tax=Natrinema salifodinae TaxID=1202768 RepID=A0A1I0PI48_9EURY|nr:TIGR00297 family protein [Natrinema salifodinae]